MKWSLKIGRFAGIDVYLHVTFLLLLGFFGYAGGAFRGDREGWHFIGLILSFFGCVLLHEYGHALMARRFGVKTRDITLLPIGGVARLERMPDKPIEEFLVAIAGPAVNVAIVAVLAPIIYFTEGFQGGIGFPPRQGPFLELLLFTNLWMIVFNMIPAFPMDGGRVVRSLLAMKLGAAQATAIASRLGKIIAVGFVVFAFLNQGYFMLAVVGVFVWIGADQENRMTQARHLFQGVTAARIMRTDILMVDANDTLARAASLLVSSGQQLLPVRHDGQVIGTIGEREVRQALMRFHPSAAAIDFMDGNPHVVDSDAPVEEVLVQLRTSGVPALLVYRAAELAGIVSADNLNTYALFREAGAQTGFGPGVPAPPPLPRFGRDGL